MYVNFGHPTLPIYQYRGYLTAELEALDRDLEYTNSAAPLGWRIPNPDSKRTELWHAADSSGCAPWLHVKRRVGEP
jgi:hypothetical protein